MSSSFGLIGAAILLVGSILGLALWFNKSRPILPEDDGAEVEKKRRIEALYFFVALMFSVTILQKLGISRNHPPQPRSWQDVLHLMPFILGISAFCVWLSYIKLKEGDRYPRVRRMQVLAVVSIALFGVVVYYSR
jgi:hypothetical protein